MKKILLSALCSGFLAAPVRAQTASVPSRYATVLDLTGAVGPTLGYASAAAWRLRGLGANGRFQLGLGLRASHYFADRNLLDNQTTSGGAVIQVRNPRLTSLNAAFQLRARVAGPLQVGFNLDVLGVSFGPGRPLEAPAAGQEAVRPVRGNVLLGGARDRGSLNSEFYVAVALPRGLGIRAGWSHLVTAYQTDADRYRRFRNLAALGLSYQLP